MQKRIFNLWLVTLIFTAFYYLFSKIIPFPNYIINLLNYTHLYGITHFVFESIKVFIWIGAIYFLYLYFEKIYRWLLKEEEIVEGLIKDEEQGEIVIRYFQERCIPLKRALLIQGKWSTGKTDFYLGTLKEKLENEFNRKVIYISCLGLRKVDDIILQILNQLFKLETLSILSSYLKSVLSASASFRQGLVPEETIIVLDDIERIAEDQSNHEELFGLINYLLQRKNCKILIISNDSEITNKNYRNLKEKLCISYEYIRSRQTTKLVIADYFCELSNQVLKEIFVEKLAILADQTNQLRAIHQTAFDIQDICKQYIQAIGKVKCSNEVKNQLLAEYFRYRFGTYYKLIFLKRLGKVDLYKQYREDYNKSGGNSRKSSETLKDLIFYNLTKQALDDWDHFVISADLFIAKEDENYLDRSEHLFEDSFIIKEICNALLFDCEKDEFKDIIEAELKVILKEKILIAFEYILQFQNLNLDEQQKNLVMRAFLCINLLNLKFNILSEEEKKINKEIEEKKLKPKWLKDLIDGTIRHGYQESQAILSKLDDQKILLKKLSENYT